MPSLVPELSIRKDLSSAVADSGFRSRRNLRDANTALRAPGLVGHGRLGLTPAKRLKLHPQPEQINVSSSVPVERRARNYFFTTSNSKWSSLPRMMELR